MAQVKKWYLSRTLLLACAQAGVGIIVAILAENPEIKGAGGLAVIKSLLDIVLRLDTNKVIK